MCFQKTSHDDDDYNIIIILTMTYWLLSLRFLEEAGSCQRGRKWERSPPEMGEKSTMETGETPGYGCAPSICVGSLPRGRTLLKISGCWQDAEDRCETSVPSSAEILGFSVGTKLLVGPKSVSGSALCREQKETTGVTSCGAWAGHGLSVSLSFFLNRRKTREQSPHSLSHTVVGGLRVRWWMRN